MEQNRDYDEKKDDINEIMKYIENHVPVGTYYNVFLPMIADTANLYFFLKDADLEEFFEYFVNKRLTVDDFISLYEDESGDIYNIVRDIVDEQDYTKLLKQAGNARIQKIINSIEFPKITDEEQSKKQQTKKKMKKKTKKTNDENIIKKRNDDDEFDDMFKEFHKKHHQKYNIR